VPQDLHGHARVHVEGGQQRPARRSGSAVVLISRLSGWARKFVGGSCSRPARWTMQAVSRASWGVPTGDPVSRTASS
jgi:hypothetical protein